MNLRVELSGPSGAGASSCRAVPRERVSWRVAQLRTSGDFQLSHPPGGGGIDTPDLLSSPSDLLKCSPLMEANEGLAAVVHAGHPCRTEQKGVWSRKDFPLPS